MDRPTQFPETATALELKETPFSTPAPAKLDFKTDEELTNIPFQIEWDDFDTGTLDE